MTSNTTDTNNASETTVGPTRWKRRLRFAGLGCVGLIGAAFLLVVGVASLIANGFIKTLPEKPTAESAKPTDRSASAKQPTTPMAASTNNVRSAQEHAEIKRKLADLLAGEKTLRRENVEDRLSFWNDIVRLAPDNEQYVRRRNEAQKEDDAMAPYRDNPELAGEIVKVRGRRGGFGTVMIADLTIRNRGLSNLKDFVVLCEVKAPSGTIVSRPQTVVYEMVEARSTRTIRNVSVGFMNSQATTANCSIERATID